MSERNVTLQLTRHEQDLIKVALQDTVEACEKQIESIKNNTEMPGTLRFLLGEAANELLLEYRSLVVWVAAGEGRT